MVLRLGCTDRIQFSYYWRDSDWTSFKDWNKLHCFGVSITILHGSLTKKWNYY